uniref:DUF4942 domain-containing protein n=1 Tax=viral metagenome TaxID=1070528 RepID=A0A6M3ILZ6_9ZZZZ
MTELEIMPYETVNQIINNYNLAVNKIQTAYTLLGNAQTLLKSFMSYPHVMPNNKTLYDNGVREVKDVLRKLKSDAWRGILEKTQAPKFMTATRYQEFERSLEKPEILPEITIESVRDFIDNLVMTAPNMLLEFIKETFNWLLPGCWNKPYKTNEKSKYEIQEKIIKECVFSAKDKYGFLPRLNYHSQQELRSMDAAFHLMDGKGIPKNGSAAYSAIKTAEQEKRMDAETEYFKFKWFNNGNCHIIFKRLDLVERMNQVAGENLLKPN